MSISEEDVRYVAGLAKLDLSPEEVRNMVRDLDAILSYAAHLETVDTSEIDLTGSEGSDGTPLRPDRSDPWLDPEQALGPAPAVSGPWFKVPPVLGGE